MRRGPCGSNSSELMSHPEPEKYTIDEMLERLRRKEASGGPEDGEWVTRPDGSQVLKVRRRRRRSKQPQKDLERKQRRRKLWTVSAVSGLVFVLALGFVGWLIFLNSTAYQQSVIEKLGRWTGSQLDFHQFRATPVSVGAARVEAVWPEESPAARLVLQNLQGALSLESHLTGQWKGEAIRAATGELTLRPGIPTPIGTDFEGAAPLQLPVRSANFTVRFGNGERPAAIVTGADATFVVPDPKFPASNLVLQDGRFRLEPWGLFKVRFASVRTAPDGVRVGNIQLVPETSPEAEIRLVGEDLPAIGMTGGVSELRVNLKDVPAEILFDEGLGKILDGRFETPEAEAAASLLLVDVTDPASARLVLPFQASLSANVSLLKLNVFPELAAAVDDPRLSRPKFQTEARGYLRREATQVRLEGLDLVSEGLLKVRGHMIDKEGGLAGSLEIGLPEHSVNAIISGPLKDLFSASEGGYQWITVNLSGTVKEPKDDFAEQLRGGIRRTSPTSGGTNSLEREFFELTAPPGD